MNGHVCMHVVCMYDYHIAVSIKTLAPFEKASIKPLTSPQPTFFYF